MGVNTTHRLYGEFIERWIRCRDTFNGTDAVKGKGTDYLPQLDSHVNDAIRYGEYKLRALFFNAMGRTVEGLGGFIFQKPLIVDAPAIIEDDLNDVTMTGIDLATFALGTGRELLLTGRFGILMDLLSEDQERTDDVPQRPYWIGYAAEDIINWRTERRGDDPAVLTRVVLREWAEEPNPKDEFEMLEVEQFRVLELTDEGYSQTVWRKLENSEKYFIFIAPVFPQRRGENLMRIPFLCLGPTAITCDVAKPPLIDMVDVNLSHYRTMADLEHGRHFTALPTPWVSGAREQEDQLFIGGGVAWDLEKGGMAGMVEFTSQGLGSLVIAETDKRKMMAILGARLLEEAPNAPETATAFIGRHSGEGATLRTMCNVLSRAFTQILQWHGWWVGTEAFPEEVNAKVELNKEFMQVKMDSQEVQAQLQLLQGEAISYTTFYHNITVGGWTRPGIDVEEERDEITKEGGNINPNETDEIVEPQKQPVVIEEDNFEEEETNGEDTNDSES